MAAESENQIEDRELYLCFHLIKERKFEEAEKKIQAGIDGSEKAELKGLYLSAMGVLFKVQKDYKKSYKFYQQAEKCLPDDPSLKIITSTLLIYEFAQHDLALKKLDSVLKGFSDDPVLKHHALALKTVALLLSGQKPKAEESLSEILLEDFSLLRSATNVDFRLPEALVKKKFALDGCRSYLEKARELAVEKKEMPYQAVIEALLKEL